MINNESLVYEMNLNSENNLKFEKIKSFKDENMEKLFHDLIMAVNKVRYLENIRPIIPLNMIP